MLADDAITALWTDLIAQMGLEVVYTRGLDVVPLTAVPGSTTHVGDDQAATSTDRESIDWLVLAADLVLDGELVEPKTGDAISHNGLVYRVSYSDFQRCWDWVGQARKVYRIHAHLSPS